MANGYELTCSVHNLFPTNESAVSFDTGYWGMNIIACRVVAWYSELEDNIDNAGINRENVANWDDITVGNNTTLIMSFKPPAQPYHHLSFYYQTVAHSSHFDVSIPATKCTATFLQSDIDIITCTVPSDDNLLSITFGTDPTEVEITLISNIQGTTRQNTLRAYNGLLVKKSYTNSLTYEQLDLTLNMGSLSASEIKIILGWIKNSTRIEMAESLTDDEVYIASYLGKFTGTDYLHTRHKRSASEFTLIFQIESEILEDELS
jgi:hypothetical protein